MKTTDVHESRRRFCTRIGCVLIAAALCFVSLAVFSTPVSAATQNSGITSGKVYRIINLGSGKYLNVTGGRDQDDINVNQYTGDGTNTQDFVIRWISAESCYKIYPVCSSNGSGRVLHIARSGSAPANGGNLVIKTASSGDAASQRFQIDTVGFNLFYIRPVSNTSLYLTANGDSNGTWTGTGANTSGNVVAKTLSTGTPGDKRYQRWIIVEKTQYSNYKMQLPFADYPSESYYTKSGNACSGHNSCISFWGGSQCLAFAREVYARNFGGFRLSIDNATGSTCSGYVNDLDKLKNYIRDNVGLGGHIRVSQNGSQNEHSMIVQNFNDSKIQVYDANSNGTCVIRQRWLTYAEFASKYPTIQYCHKGKHTHICNMWKKQTNYAHAKYCVTCNYSVYDSSSVEPHTYVQSGTTYRCSRCGYTTSSPEDIASVSSPEELENISPIEESLTVSAEDNTELPPCTEPETETEIKGESETEDHPSEPSPPVSAETALPPDPEKLN